MPPEHIGTIVAGEFYLTGVTEHPVGVIVHWPAPRELSLPPGFPLQILLVLHTKVFSPYVLCQGCFLARLIITVGTFIRPLSTMYMEVSCQIFFYG